MTTFASTNRPDPLRSGCLGIAAVLLLTGSGLAGCDTPAETATGSESPSSASAIAAPAAKPAASSAAQTMKFQSQKIIEFSYAAIKPGKHEQLFGEYFPKVGPIVAKYGGKSLGSLQVVRSKVDGAQPQIVAFFEWPSVQAYFDLHDDPEFQKLVPTRDDALQSASVANFFRVEEDTNVELRSDRLYELTASWGEPGSEPDRPSGAGTPLVAVTSMQQSPEDLDKIAHSCVFPAGKYRPSTLSIVEWPSSEALTRFEASEARKRAKDPSGGGDGRVERFVTELPPPPA